MKFTLVAPMDEAIDIQLNGKRVTLRPVAASKQRRRGQVGDRSWETFSAGNVKVRVDYVVTRVCRPERRRLRSN